MIIEKLSFVISPPDRLEDFIKADAEIWDPWLRGRRGFLRKTYQRYPGGRLDLRIFWCSQRDLDAASKSPEIPALDVRLRARFLGVFTRLP